MKCSLKASTQSKYLLSHTTVHRSVSANKQIPEILVPQEMICINLLDSLAKHSAGILFFPANIDWRESPHNFQLNQRLTDWRMSCSASRTSSRLSLKNWTKLLLKWVATNCRYVWLDCFCLLFLSIVLYYVLELSLWLQQCHGLSVCYVS